MMSTSDITKTKVVGKEVSEFESSYLNKVSPFFKDIFNGCIKKIFIETHENMPTSGKITYYVELNTKSANIIGIAHGGAVATLMENLGNASLFYFTNSQSCYKTIDANINYKSPVPLEKELRIEIICDKINFNTSFLEMKICNRMETLTQASFIKMKLRGVNTVFNPKF